MNNSIPMVIERHNFIYFFRKICKIENNATTHFNKRIFDFTFKTGEIKQSINQYSNPNKDES